MIPIKILCGCGQKYSFDVESAATLVGAAIQCPACGADGAPAANQMLAAYSAPQPTRPNGLQLRAHEAPAGVEIPVPPRIDFVARTGDSSSRRRNWFLPIFGAALLLSMAL